MKLPRWLPIVAFAAFGAGAIACAVDGDLNPQPLPPGPDDTKETTGSSGEVATGTSSGSGSVFGGGASSGGSSSGATATPPSADAGALEDGGDGGDAGGDAAAK